VLEHLSDVSPGPEARFTAREAVELAFVSALQRLPPRQAAVLLLCDVLGYPLGEAAPMVDATPTAAKGLLQRARTSLARHREHARDAPPPASARERDLVRRFADAFATDDIAGLVELLTDDAWLAMPPAPHEYHGTEAIASFLGASAVWRAGRRLRLRPTRANGQPGFVCEFADETAQPAGLIVLTLAGDRVRGITRFLDNSIAAYFDAAASGLAEPVSSPRDCGSDAPGRR
jgi:RNA polymerase sigma-70 factor (ECF subfamily)